MYKTRDLFVLIEKSKNIFCGKSLRVLKKLSYCDSYVRKYSYMYVLTLGGMQSMRLWLNDKVGGSIGRKVHFRCKK